MVQNDLARQYLSGTYLAQHGLKSVLIVNMMMVQSRLLHGKERLQTCTATSTNNKRGTDTSISTFGRCTQTKKPESHESLRSSEFVGEPIAFIM